MEALRSQHADDGAPDQRMRSSTFFAVILAWRTGGGYGAVIIVAIHKAVDTRAAVATIIRLDITL